VAVVAPHHASNVDEFRNHLSALAADAGEKIEALEHHETEGTIGAFVGATKSASPCAAWLMKEHGVVPMPHLKMEVLRPALLPRMK
jgi:hypothetical protein